MTVPAGFIGRGRYPVGVSLLGRLWADARILSLAEGLVETLHEVDAALGRIAKGTYGSCESCGAQIPPERLDARPVARLCLDCKQRLG